jgi:hypothetical protein
MKKKLPLLFLYLVFQFGFSQTERLIQGRVLCADFPLEDIEIVNLVTEKSTISDTNGRFSISAKVEDMLVIVSEKYEYKRVFLDKEFLDKNNFTILLTRKPEQLEEVVVISKISFPHIGLNQDYADQSNLEKSANNPKPIGVYDGTLVNSPDFMRIGGMLLRLFAKPKENALKTPKTEFKKIASATCNQDFFDKTLQIKPDEIALFLEFCDADPKSKAILENTNPLKVMDFLFAKNVEFKKLSALEKH